MKKFFALLLVMILAKAACAAELNLDALTVEIPHGWTYGSEYDGNMIFHSADKRTIVTLTVQPVTTPQERVELNPYEIAAYLAGQVLGSNAQTTPIVTKDGLSSFTIESVDEENAKTVTEFRLSVEEDRWFVMIVIENGKDNRDVESLLRSIRYR